MLDDLGQRAAELAPAHEGHDAVRAHLVTATHDRNVCAEAIRRRDDHGPVEVRSVQRLQLGEESVRLADVEDVVELREPSEECLAVLHRHASRQRDRAAGTSPLPGDELAELAEDLLLGIGPHRARDEHRDVRVIERRLRDAADVGELRSELLAVGIVHLTADVPEMDARRSSEHRDLRLAARRPRDERERSESASGVAQDRNRTWHRRSLAVCRHPIGCLGRS